MRIAVDAMGGDNAPEAVVKGATMAAAELGVEIILVGRRALIEAALSGCSYPDGSISINDAPDVISMDESPSSAIRSKKGSSINVMLDLVKSGEAGAAVSAGNTGAVLAASILILRTLRGIDRPALASFIPTTLGGWTMLIDAGANVECRPRHLFQFGIMGYVYAKIMLEEANPKVGLLSVGREAYKGNEVTRQANEMLKRSSINFIGNIEGRDLYRGLADVIVCDGFTGNIALKITECMAYMFDYVVEKGLSTSLGISREIYRKVKRDIKAALDYLDWSEYGGAPLLGANGVSVKAHGSSSDKAIKNAIKLAHDLAAKKVNHYIQSDLDFNAEIQNSGELRSCRTRRH